MALGKHIVQALPSVYACTGKVDNNKYNDMYLDALWLVARHTMPCNLGFSIATCK